MMNQPIACAPKRCENHGESKRLQSITLHGQRCQRLPRGIGFQPVIFNATGWKPIPRIDRTILNKLKPEIFGTQQNEQTI